MKKNRTNLWDNIKDQSTQFREKGTYEVQITSRGQAAAHRRATQLLIWTEQYGDNWQDWPSHIILSDESKKILEGNKISTDTNEED